MLPAIPGQFAGDPLVFCAAIRNENMAASKIKTEQNTSDKLFIGSVLLYFFVNFRATFDLKIHTIRWLFPLVAFNRIWGMGRNRAKNPVSGEIIYTR